MKTMTLIGAVAACLVCLLANRATAVEQDAKRYSGAFCMFSGHDQYGASRTYSKFQNSSGESQQVICSGLQDALYAELGFSYIIASESIDEDTCRVRVRLDDGTRYSYLQYDVVGEGTGYNTTRWFPFAFQEPQDLSTYAITCDLPDGAAILSYRFTDYID